MDNNSIVEHLYDMQDLQYRDFVAKLTPSLNKDNIIGVRTPMLRKYAKQLQKSDDKYSFLSNLPHRYYEENNLHGMLLKDMNADIDVVLDYINIFLPYIDNWATCDTLTPKLFAKYPLKVRECIDSWLKSEHIYTIRFAIVVLMQLYLDKNFDERDLETLAGIKSDEYYVNMALAWYYSTAFVKQYDTTVQIFEKKMLDKWVHNKSIQKAIESYRISPQKKDYLSKLRIRSSCR